MIDNRIIRDIIKNQESRPGIQLEENKKREWSRDSMFIFFPAGIKDYNERLNGLDAVQFLRRIRLLYTMLLRNN